VKLLIKTGQDKVASKEMPL